MVTRSAYLAGPSTQCDLWLVGHLQADVDVQLHLPAAWPGWVYSCGFPVQQADLETTERFSLQTMSVGFYFSISLRVALSCLINKRIKGISTCSQPVYGWVDTNGMPNRFPQIYRKDIYEVNHSPPGSNGALAVALVTRTAGNHRCLVSKYRLVIWYSYWKLPFIVSGFTHWKWRFSIAMPVYQRVGF